MENSYKKAIIIFLFSLFVMTIHSQTSSTSHYNNANELYKNKMYKEAIVEYTNAIDIDKNDTDAYNNRGIAYYQIGEYINAIGDFNKVIANEPNEIFAYQSRAITYNTIGLHREANKDYKKVIELNSKFAYSYFGLLYSSYYISKKEFKEAFIFFKANMDNFKEREWEYNLAGFISCKVKEKKIRELAGKDAQKLSDLNFTLGFLNLIKNRKSKAKANFTDCIKIGQTDSPEYFLSKLELTRL
jgi:tetratricopeptide (TPR) repeat protein